MLLAALRGKRCEGFLIVARAVEAETSPAAMARAALALRDLVARGAL